MLDGLFVFLSSEMEIRARFIVLCLSVELIHVWFTRGAGGVLVSTVLDSYGTI